MQTIQIPTANESNNTSINIQKSMIIVGANGTGKSRFGSRIELMNPTSKRISAQRYLQLAEVVPNQDYDTSRSSLNSAYKNQQPIQPQNDYMQVLMSLFAEESRRNEEAVLEIQNCGVLNKDKLRKSVKEQLLEVWSFIYPNKDLRLIKNKIKISNGITEFSGIEMSDGEKVGLYLISQILLADVNCILILDEPELHLHKALMVRLWNKLEEYRKDCIFIYITHDLDFAVSKNSEKLIWLKNYTSESVWDWQEIVPTECIPENLFLEILGSKKPILFIEGDKGSLDVKIYQNFYENFTIIPCGSCEKVIQAVRGLKVHPQLNGIPPNQ
jgi:ATPase subunit of ABC transporter with duplicated ATPase domains